MDVLTLANSDHMLIGRMPCIASGNQIYFELLWFSIKQLIFFTYILK